ncbi:MAG TPA: DUF2341 domain-containing protein [Mucilaginibacter sp.]|nr:DUF2341 domain-containing protein [Mucilaginibacter sp.]
MLLTPNCKPYSVQKGAKLLFFFVPLILFLIAGNEAFSQSVSTPVDNDGNVNYVLANASNGTAVNVTAYSTVSGSMGNIALNKTVYVSSTEQAAFPGSAAVDGNTSTRWSSEFTDSEWITVDLGVTCDISEVKLLWEAAYGKKYKIQVSDDNSNWTNIYSVTNGNGGTDDLTGLSGTGRYVRMKGQTRGTGYGYSLYEFQVYGTPVISYSLTSNPGSLFTIDSSTGIVTVNNSSSLSAGAHTITVKATASSSNASASFTITAIAPPTAPDVSSCGGSATVTATESPTGGTYKWYTAASGGTLLQSSTSNTYTASVSGTTTYYVSYTIGTVTTSRTAVNVTLGTTPVLSSAPTSPSSGLYLSYPFDGNANDVSGNSNNGTVQGSASLTTDRYGASNKAYSFNGSSQYISTTTQAAAPGPQNFSISVWFKTSSAGGKLVGFGSSKTGLSGSYDRHIYMTNSGQIYYGIYPNTVKTLNSTATYADGNWHHVVATTSTTYGSYLYIDGAVVAGDPTMTTSQNYSGYWRVGYDKVDGWTNSPTNAYFTGSLDDIAIYNTALTASDVYTLYGAGSLPTCAGSPLQLQANTVSGATYSWSGPGGYTSTAQNPTVSSSATTANAGTYTLTVTGSGGCSTVINVTAVVNDAPTSTFTATSSVEIGANSTITFTGTYAATSTYTWDFNGGTVVSGSGVGPYTVNWSASGTKTVTLMVTNSAGCSSISTQNVVVAAATYGNYGFKKSVTLNTTSLGITSNLTDFPALLSIQDNNLIISGTCADKVFNPDGPNYDFAFVDAATGSELYYQVESYNQATGTLLVWVKIPTLTYATNNAITFFYGSQSPTVTHNTAFFQNTWSSDYKAVFHFNETSYSGSVTDGTGGGHTGTASGMSASDLVAGKIGNAYTFASGKKITSNAVNITGSFTISAWVKPTTINTDQKIMTNQTSVGSSSGGYKLGIYYNNTAETESATAGDRGSSPTPPAVSANTWYYIQGVFNGNTLSTYVNGAAYAVLTTTTAPSATSPLYIGAGEGGGNYYFNGIIDEARISNVAKSADWLKAEYVDQNNPSAFTSAGSSSVISTNAASLPGALTYTWKGLSTDPANANNWDNTTAGISNQLPAFDGTASVVIPAGLSYYPVMNGSGSVYGLTIASGASINLNGNTLNVGCNIYNSAGGQILYGTSNTSAINWNGSMANQTYTGTNTGNTASLGSMTINNSSGGTVTISGGPVDIYKSLTITKGNLVVGASPASLTLKSSATQTAYVSALPSGSSITGTVKVERYLTGGTGYRGYRLLSSPVYAATVSSNKVYDISYLGSSMYLTGSTGTGGGFDKTGNPTLYLFREDQTPNNSSFTSGNFWGISKINNSPTYNYYLNGGSTGYNIPVGNGVMVFFRGNKSSSTLANETTTTYVPVAATLTSSGTLNQGQVIVHDWYTPASANLGYTGTGTGTNYKVRGFNLVGNPYASSIDWETFNTSSQTTGIYGANISTTIYEFNPVTKNYDTYQKGGAHTNHGSNIIPSGGAFYIQASGSNPQLIFNESAKTSAQNTGLDLFMSGKGVLAKAPVTGSIPDPHLRLQMAKDSVNTDDVYIGLNGSAKRGYVSDEDAPYRVGSGLVNLASFSADNVPLAINRLSYPKQADTIRLRVGASSGGLYQLTMTEFEGLPDLYEVWLMDAYTKDSLDIRHNPDYAFNLYANDTASYGSSRFSLIIRQNPALALHLLDFKGSKTSSGARIDWTTENESNYTNFTVERSTDNGNSFRVVGGFASGSEGNYSLLDKNPSLGTDQYRLKMEDINGTVTYSRVVTLMYSDLSNSIAGNAVSIYPNPAINTINVAITPSTVQLQNPVAGSYNIIITSSNGTVVKKAASSQSEWQGSVENLLPGSYIVQVVDKQENKVVGKSKFVKL